MAIDTIQYPSPVTVNGFKCANCNEVDLAARRIDPAHPRSGVDDITAQQDPTRSEADKVRLAKQHAAAVPPYGADGNLPVTMGATGVSLDRQA